MSYRILMIAPTPFFADRGCHVQIYEQMRSLRKLGHEVTICTYHNGRDLPGLDIRRIIKIPWYNKIEAGPSYHKLYLDLLLLVKSLRTAWQIKPDIIHGHLHEGAVIGYLVSRITKVPLLFDLQGSLTGELRAHNFHPERGLLYKLLGWAEGMIDHLPEVVVTQSTEMIEELKNKFRLPAEKVFLTLDGVDTDEFRPGLDSTDLRASLNLPEGKKIVVYLGLLNEYQGVDCLIQSIPHVIARSPKVHFLIMGFPNEDKYQRMAERSGVGSYVTFTGRIDYKEAPRYICLGDVAISPKLGETEANGKLYNYMACGLPTVAFDTQVNREILGDLGIYAQLGDPASLAEATLTALSDGFPAEELRMKLRQRVLDHFSWDNVARRLESCYELAYDRCGQHTKAAFRWNKKA
ncbi:MAG: glycosyltransferase family 4 protein [Chloroflexi bacterium]|nr:glycosyltransferase family 4 protein [Chloroflexota bacterium]MCL5075273.1 glycosyltransferase family 4 protein [Chloroflexota bacterium]